MYDTEQVAKELAAGIASRPDEIISILKKGLTYQSIRTLRSAFHALDSEMTIKKVEDVLLGKIAAHQKTL